MLLLIGCGPASDEATTLRVWAHAGQASEREVITDQLERFDAARPECRLAVELLPERSYVAQVQAAAVAGDLPDVLEIDGPYVANLAWQGRLQELEPLLEPAVVDDLLPSIRAQGTYTERLFAVGTFDAGLAIYVRPSVLRAHGVRVPETPERAWSGDELDRVLQTLAADDADGQVLDLKLNYPQEWFPFAFAPWLASAGGGMLGGGDGQPRRAGGMLDGAASVAAMERMQRWARRGWLDENIDDAAFVTERVALSWSGHWEYPRYRERFGDDLAVVPLPDLGEGSRTGQGSWMWAMRAGTEHPELGGELLEYLLRPEEVLAMVEANGAVPGRRAALERSELYREGGPLRLLADQLLAGRGVPRPRTPAYPVISSTFHEAFQRIRDGAEARRALSRAAETIDRDITDNEGYPPVALEGS